MKAWFLAAFVMVGGCGIFEPASDEERQLENALAGWKRQGITEYSYVYARTCECPPAWQRPYRVVVRDGEVVEATDFADGTVRSIERMLTIDDLFDLIRKGLADDADVVRIVYDRSMYYPIDMMIDDDLTVADDEKVMRASGLIRLK